jgi:cytochrome c-type biogenesis protein CcmF
VQEINYIGEHTWAGQLGHLFTLVSFVAALLATAAYFFGTRRNTPEWTSLGRLGFRLHTVAVLGIVVVLFVMLFSHWFEYDYVWKHSNTAMPMKYILSCFWEGQEGSFLLWTFWHVVIGNILIARAGKWEAPVMTVMALVQVFLATMLLGVYVGEMRIGSSPFLLIRELPENLGLPWTFMADYLTKIPQFADGRGLNPLLQNYWMVIHPPTLFLGFAATLVPFAYAIGGLWLNDRRGWMKPALPWTFFGVMVLGTGILMGGAWAYEALSFGGFWAWDPVENASLVPWLTLVGAGHLMLINQRTPKPGEVRSNSIFSTLLLTLISFILVLYSTFLTRSGVLGDTSVHSFTGDGMLPGLLLFLLFFIALPVMMLVQDKGQRRFYAFISVALLAIGVLLELQVAAILFFAAITIGMLVSAYRQGAWNTGGEEALWSRDFWMFIASLVLLLSAAQITFSTSVPVFNLLLEPFAGPLTWLGERTGSAFITGLAEAKLAPPGEAIAHYNKWQVPFAFIISLLVAFTQYLRWKNSDRSQFMKQMLLPALIALAITVLASILLKYRIGELNLIALFFATSFAAVANASYIGRVLKGNLAKAGPSVAHVGFALVLLGALVSTSRQNEISRNTRNMDLRYLNEGFSNNSDILLYRGDTVRMGEFYVSYRERDFDGSNLYYGMEYFAVEPRRYSAGDTVRVGDILMRARQDHVASENYLEDMQAHWEGLDQYSKRTFWNTREWSPTQPGTRQFDLAPFVQLNPRFGNVAEPSTKHWLHRDLYTHIRYADLGTEKDSVNDGWMPDRLYEKMVGDTIITPTSMVIIDSLFTVRDSVTRSMLGDRYTVYSVKLRVRDLYQRDRWFEARPLVIYGDGQPIAGKTAELASLRIRYGLASVEQGLPEGQKPKLGINVAEAEFVVMQAIVFPGINILWIGCVLLFIGTLMAVRQRVRRRKEDKRPRRSPRRKPQLQARS